MKFFASDFDMMIFFQDTKLKHQLGDAKILLFEGESLGTMVRFLLCSLEVMGLETTSPLVRIYGPYV